MTAPQLAPYLSLYEAASAVSNKLGTSWTVSDLIGCAYKNEISICARISTGATLVRVEPIKGEENTIIAEAGSLTFISAKSCRALLLTGQAEFTEITYPSSLNLAGKLTEAMITVWKLADGEIAPTFGIDDCRVSSDGVLQLISKQTAIKDLPITQADNANNANVKIWTNEKLKEVYDFYNNEKNVKKTKAFMQATATYYGVSARRIYQLLEEYEESKPNPFGLKIQQYVKTL